MLERKISVSVKHAFVSLALMMVLGACAPEVEDQPDSQGGEPTTGAADMSDDMMDVARVIHDQVLVLDAHADIVPLSETSRYGDPDGTSKVTPEKLHAGGVDAVVMAIAVGSGPRTAAGDAAARAEADAELAAVLEIADTYDNVVIVRTADELVKAHADGLIAFLLGFQNARILQGQVSALDEFFAAGVRVFALTHLGHNNFADSSRPVYDSVARSYEVTEEHGGLSDLGKDAIRQINALGGVVDVSQLSKQATLQVVALSTAPVIASHSNVQVLSDVARNLSDEEIDQIAAKGGVVHLAAFTAYLLDLSDPELIANIKSIRRDAGIDERYTYPFELYWEISDAEVQTRFLSDMRDLLGPATIDRLIDHVDYVVDRVGIDHVGLSTDFNHGGGIQGFGNASEALNVTAGLLRRGYSAADIEKIWSGNFLRVMREAQALATAN